MIWIGASNEVNLYARQLDRIVSNKKVLFITTKNIDYIRNTQEIRILNGVASSIDIIYSDKKNYILRVLSVWNKIKRDRVQRADIVFIGFAPQLVIPFLGRRLKGKIIVMDFFISVYDTLICDRKKFRDKGLIAKMCHQLDEKTIHKADHVITDTKVHADYFISEFDGNADIFETIYLEADPMIYYPRIQNRPEKVRNKFVVLFFGSILPLQGVDIVLDAIRELKNRGDIYFDIIGPISKEYNKPLQDNVRYIDWLSQEELAEHIANAELCLAGHFNNKIEKAKRTIPGKAYIYEAMGKRMILGDNVANRELFAEDRNHIFVKMGDSLMLAKTIVESKVWAEREMNEEM